MATTPTVNTMRGPKPTDALGFTLMHEHVFVHSAGVMDNWPHLWDRDAEIQKAITTLNEAKANGVDTILDLTTIDLGRDIARLKEVADHVDLNMIVATGLWLDAPRSISRMSPAEMADLFIHDIEEGIGDTGVKAGAIKVASEPVVDGPNAQILKAAAMAHRKTGVPISTHTFVRNASGLAQQNVFERAGVDLSRVVIGHTGDSEDLEYVEAIVKRGSYIGMDRFGLGLSTERRAAVVAELCERGHTNRMVLSHDSSCYMALGAPDPDRPWQVNYGLVRREVIPLLLDLGVTEAQVVEMTVENPRRIFEAQGGY